MEVRRHVERANRSRGNRLRREPRQDVLIICEKSGTIVARMCRETPHTEVSMHRLSSWLSCFFSQRGCLHHTRVSFRCTRVICACILLVWNERILSRCIRIRTATNRGNGFLGQVRGETIRHHFVHQGIELLLKIFLRFRHTW